MQSETISAKIPDNRYWQKQIKCQNACPVNTDAKGYVRAVAEGDFEKAYLIARAPNPLASICGRICGAPCEAACRRSDLDEAISIRALKRFVTEKFGVESHRFDNAPLNLIKNYFSSEEKECEGIEDLEHFLKHFQKRDLAITKDAPTVGIIGSGPAGLAAAHDLCLMGIKPIIYEMEPVPAGMLYFGVPEYRLPRDLIAAEVEVIKAMGTEIICNMKVGEDVTLRELRDRHNAVLIAVGAKKSRTIPIENINAPGVLGGIDFLRDVALNENVELGEKIIVIGGGNVAYDVARTLIRQTEYDISRTALRLKGVKEVHLVCLESLEEMPADTVEIQEGEEEGVVRHNLWGPERILVDENGKAIGVEFKRCLSVFDEKGRFSPHFDEHNTQKIFADNIVLSIGQATDLSFIDSEDINLTERGELKMDPSQTMTEAEGVFAAGDVAMGLGLMIDAIANGKKVARKISNYLTGGNLLHQMDVSHTEIPSYKRERGYECIAREGVPAMPPDERKRAMNLTVESGFTEKQSIPQASRCLDCGVNTVFNSERCILCGGCVDVCPEACLKLVSLSRISGDEDLETLVEHRYGCVPLEQGSAIIKDETRCIRCGLCAERCPVDAITMEQFTFVEEFV